MTNEEIMARLNAKKLREPKVDSFAQSKIDLKNAPPVVPLPPPTKKKPFTGGIPQVDKQLKDAGALQDE